MPKELIVVEPVTVRVPFTPRVETGAVEPTPTLPPAVTVKMLPLVVVPMDTMGSVAVVVVAAMESSATGEEVPMPKLPLEETIISLIPVEEAMANGSRVPVPLMLKAIVEDVALIPATVPLSISTPVPKVEGPVHLARYPLVPKKEEDMA